jgi:hypothetical protein
MPAGRHGNTIQGAVYDALGVYHNASAAVVGGTLQNNGYAGLLVGGGDAVAVGLTTQRNRYGVWAYHS